MNKLKIFTQLNIPSVGSVHTDVTNFFFHTDLEGFQMAEISLL